MFPSPAGEMYCPYSVVNLQKKFCRTPDRDTSDSMTSACLRKIMRIRNEKAPEIFGFQALFV